MAGLSLAEEEDGGGVFQVEEDFNLCLIGRFLTNRQAREGSSYQGNLSFCSSFTK